MTCEAPLSQEHLANSTFSFGSKILHSSVQYEKIFNAVQQITNAITISVILCSLLSKPSKIIGSLLLFKSNKYVCNY